MTEFIAELKEQSAFPSYPVLWLDHSVTFEENDSYRVVTCAQSMAWLRGGSISYYSYLLLFSWAVQFNYYSGKVAKVLLKSQRNLLIYLLFYQILVYILGCFSALYWGSKSPIDASVDKSLNLNEYFLWDFVWQKFDQFKSHKYIIDKWVTFCKKLWIWSFKKVKTYSVYSSLFCTDLILYGSAMTYIIKTKFLSRKGLLQYMLGITFQVILINASIIWATKWDANCLGCILILIIVPLNWWTGNH